jgi:hypothetical protein
MKWCDACAKVTYDSIEEAREVIRRQETEEIQLGYYACSLGGYHITHIKEYDTQ